MTTNIITRHAAIAYAAEHGVQLRKFNDPIEDARPVTIDEAREIAREDGSLIWCPVDGSTADYIAAMLHGDGQVYQADDGRSLDELCYEAGGALTYRDGHGTDVSRYMFADGSAITVSGTAWDIGRPCCYAWASVDHEDSCEAAGPSELEL
jgi:hypothetical protein